LCKHPHNPCNFQFGAAVSCSIITHDGSATNACDEKAKKHKKKLVTQPTWSGGKKDKSACRAKLTIYHFVVVSESMKKDTHQDCGTPKFIDLRRMPLQNKEIPDWRLDYKMIHYAWCQLHSRIAFKGR